MRSVMAPILLLLALCLHPASAQLPNETAAVGVSCPNPNNVAGAMISPANFSCTIVADYAGTFQFVSGGAGPDYKLERNGSSWGIPAASRAELCKQPTKGYYSPYTGIQISGSSVKFTGTVSTSSAVITNLSINPTTAQIAPRTPISGTGIVAGAYVVSHTPVSITMSANGTVNGTQSLTLGAVTLYQAYFIGYQNTLQSTAICSPVTGYFLNTTRSIVSDRAEQSQTNASANDTLEWKAPPTGLIWGQLGNDMATAEVLTNGLTINLDAGFIENGVSAARQPGHDPINIGGNNVTIHGAGSGSVIIENNSGGGNDAVGQIDVYPGALNPTLSGISLVWGDQPISMGGNNGTITLSDVQVRFGGVQGDSGSFGQQHNIYLSNNGKPGNSGPVKITALQSYDVQTGGYMLKDRVDNLTMKDSYLGCTVSPTGKEPNCEPNTTVDFPCGGNQSITHSVFERDMLEEDTQGSAPVFVQFGEEVEPTVQSTGCQQAYGTGYPTNNLVLDHDIFLNDAPPWSGYHQPWYIVQMGCNNSSNGTWSAPMTCTCTVTNSIIVGNNSATGANAYGGLFTQIHRQTNAGTCTDGGGNVVYADRESAASALGWYGLTDRFGNQCTVTNNCTKYYQPTHLAENDDGKDTRGVRVSRAHAAGLCGNGDANDPIRHCADPRHDAGMRKLIALADWTKAYWRRWLSVFLATWRIVDRRM